MTNNFDISLPVIGCEGCMNTAGALGCPIHGHRSFTYGVQNGVPIYKPNEDSVEEFIKEVNKINYRNILQPINI